MQKSSNSNRIYRREFIQLKVLEYENLKIGTKSKYYSYIYS